MTDLSNTFGTPGNRLAGMLPPKSVSAASTGNPDQGDETPKTQPPAKDPSQADPPANEVAQVVEGEDTVSDGDEGEVTQVVEGEHQHDAVDEVKAGDFTTSQVPVYVVPDLIPAVRQVREGRTNAEIAFDAIDAVHSRLRELVVKRKTPPTRSGSRFPARDSRRQRGGSRRVLWAIRATGRERKILESIRKEVGADSVSELVSVAVEARYLKKR